MVTDGDSLTTGTQLRAEFRNGNKEVWVFLPTDPDTDAGYASTLPADGSRSHLG